MPKEMELYEVNLPGDFDYKGAVPKLSGTIHAHSPRQAVRSFILRGGWRDNLPLYEEFKGRSENTEQFARPVARAIAEHYARKYYGKQEFAGRLEGIFKRMDIDWRVFDFSGLVDVLEIHYKGKWRSERQLRGAYSHIKKQQAEAASIS